MRWPSRRRCRRPRLPSDKDINLGTIRGAQNLVLPACSRLCCRYVVPTFRSAGLFKIFGIMSVLRPATPRSAAGCVF